MNGNLAIVMRPVTNKTAKQEVPFDFIYKQISVISYFKGPPKGFDRPLLSKNR